MFVSMTAAKSGKISFGPQTTQSIPWPTLTCQKKIIHENTGNTNARDTLIANNVKGNADTVTRGADDTGPKAELLEPEKRRGPRVNLESRGRTALSSRVLSALRFVCFGTFWNHILSYSITLWRKRAESEPDHHSVREMGVLLEQIRTSVAFSLKA